MSLANQIEKERKWTVMVYFASDNDLEGFALENINMMKQVGSTDEVAILAELDPSGIGQTKRFYVRDNNSTIEEDAIMSFGETNTGDPASLKNFIEWGKANFEAAHYLVVLWGHGHGWQSEDNANRAAGRTVNIVRGKGNKFTLRSDKNAEGEEQLVVKVFLSKDAAGQFRIRGVEEEITDPSLSGFLLDEKSNDVLTMDELSEALKTVGKVDILGMDACLMAMAEVGYQVKDLAHILVGSEETIPDASWPYDRILKKLVANPAMSPRDFSVQIAREYIIHYQAKSKQVAMSACNLERAEALAQALADLVKELIKAKEKVSYEVMRSRAMAQTFYIKDYVDLYDFCRLLRENCAEPDIQAKALVVMKVIGVGENPAGFVIDYGYYGFSKRDSHGVSVYFPCKDASVSYVNNQFAQAADWAEFLACYVGMATAETSRNHTATATGIDSGLKVKTGDEVKVKTGDEGKVKTGDEGKIPGSMSMRIPQSEPAGDRPDRASAGLSQSKQGEMQTTTPS